METVELPEELTPHGSLCPLVCFLERQVLFNHELEHKKEMAFRMVLLVPKHGVPLWFCDLFVDHGFLD